MSTGNSSSGVRRLARNKKAAKMSPRRPAVVKRVPRTARAARKASTRGSKKGY